MKKNFVLTSTVLASLAATACAEVPKEDWTDKDTAICVNKSGERVSDDACDNDRDNDGMSNAMLWYFIGANSHVPYYGDRARGGSYTRKAGVSYYKAPAATRMTKSQAISRGGFGSSARASSGSYSSGS